MAATGVVGLVALAAGTVCLTSGCGTLGYYAQAVGGHLDLVVKSRSLPSWIHAEGTEPRLRERLELAQRMRDFAVQELKLPDNSSYRRYADLGRGAAVWNVVATPELSLTLKTWCFPVVGCVGYRGYFDRAGADALATELQAQKLDVNVYGVPAYSTLGRTNWMGGDPLLNTFIFWGEGELARLIFHELAHQVAYADDDTTFNESFAVAVERLGGQRWLDRFGTPEARQADAEASHTVDPATTEDVGAGESAATLDDPSDAPSSVIAGPWPPRDRETEPDGLMAVGAAAATPADTLTTTPDPARARSRRRIDVMLFRIGMVLLILGGLLAFVRPQTFSLPMNVPPVSAPATPTSAPAASPSPAGVRPIDMDEARTLIVVLVSPAGSGVVDQAL